MREHEFFSFELFEAHIGVVVDALGPSVPAHVVVPDLDESFHEDLESVLGFGGVGRSELVVYFSGGELVELAFSCEEVAMLDVEVDVAEREGHQEAEK